MPKKILSKIEQYPRPHECQFRGRMDVIGSANELVAPIPVARQDQGLGAPASYNANPKHASFAAVNGDTCYPESHVEKIICRLRLNLTKDALETSKIHALKVGILVISGSYNDWDKNDEPSGDTVKSVLELTTSATHEQVYPTWTGTKLIEAFTGSNELPADMDGLTTNQKMEGVNLDYESYYDHLNYTSLGPVLKKVTSGIKWYTLTRSKPVINLKIHMKSATKAMQPYAAQFVYVILPDTNDYMQIPIASDVGASEEALEYHYLCRYYEWNQGFDMDAA